MKTPIAPTARLDDAPLFGLWIEPWEAKPRVCRFVDLGFPELRETLVVGQSRNCQIVVDSDPLVSTEHCRLIADGGAIFVEDLSSTNGTKINEIALADRQRLYVGRVISVGRSYLTVIEAEDKVPIEGATYTSWMIAAIKKHGSLRAAEGAIHRGRSTLHDALRRHRARQRRTQGR